MPAAAQARKRSPTTSIRASILFSDLRNFTAAGIRESPEDLFQGVNVVMGHQAEIINAAGGYVDKCQVPPVPAALANRIGLNSDP